MKRMKSVLLLATVFAVMSMALATANAANIVIVNADGAGEGFNDPTPAAPVGGNWGTTIGQQRLIAFTYAANIWGACIQSNVTITLNAQMNPLSCTAGSAVLGSAGTTTVHRDFAGAPAAGTWYPQALANSLAGVDLSPANPDINATFNSHLARRDASRAFSSTTVWTATRAATSISCRWCCTRSPKLGAFSDGTLFERMGTDNKFIEMKLNYTNPCPGPSCYIYPACQGGSPIRLLAGTADITIPGAVDLSPLVRWNVPTTIRLQSFAAYSDSWDSPLTLAALSLAATLAATVLFIVRRRLGSK